MNVQSRYEKYRWKQNILFNNLKPHTVGKVYKTMKTITIIPRELNLSDRESKLYIDILDSLGIKYSVRESKKDPIPVSMYEISCKTIGRTSNVLKNWIDLTMSAKEFVESYSRVQFLMRRNSGQVSLMSLVAVLEKYGYKW
jgi:hypothetical protein